MADREFHLFRWLAPVAAQDSLGATLRFLEQIVVDEAAPALQDAVFREHAAAFWLRKEAEAAGSCGVWIVAVAPPEAEASLQRAIGRHVRPEAVGEVDVMDLLLHPISSEYRRGLTEVTEIALDLHTGAEASLRYHQCELIRLACTGTDPRFGLDSYLLEHSAAYRRRSGATERDEHPWARETFWTRLYTPGPAVGLAAPLWSLWNIVVGLTPSRRNDVAAVAASIEIGCD